VLYSFNYDLIDGANRRADYTILIERIRLLDDVVHDELSGWYISHDASLPMLQAYLTATLRPEDRSAVEPVTAKIIGANLAAPVEAWLQAHGIRVLPVMPLAASKVAEFEQTLLRKRELRELAKASAARHFAAKVTRPKPPLFPLPVPVSAPKPAPSLSSMLSLYSQPEPGPLTRAIMGSSLGRP
jgi:hypothetical protein